MRPLRPPPRACEGLDLLPERAVDGEWRRRRRLPRSRLSPLALNLLEDLEGGDEGERDRLVDDEEGRLLEEDFPREDERRVFSRRQSGKWAGKIGFASDHDGGCLPKVVC